jgi:hypothetical protein
MIMTKLPIPAVHQFDDMNPVLAGLVTRPGWTNGDDLYRTSRRVPSGVNGKAADNPGRWIWDGDARGVIAAYGDGQTVAYLRFDVVSSGSDSGMVDVGMQILDAGDPRKWSRIDMPVDAAPAFVCDGQGGLVVPTDDARAVPDDAGFVHVGRYSTAKDLVRVTEAARGIQKALWTRRRTFPWMTHSLFSGLPPSSGDLDTVMIDYQHERIRATTRTGAVWNAEPLPNGAWEAGPAGAAPAATANPLSELASWLDAQSWGNTDIDTTEERP